MLFTHVNKGGTAEECLSSLESKRRRGFGAASSRFFIWLRKTRERRVFPWQRCKTTRWISWSRCARTAALFSPAPKSTAVWPTRWDYGPLGVEFKNNVKKAWWQKFVQESKYNVGSGLRHSDEPGSLGGFRPRGRLQRSADGLQGLQGALPRRQADRGLHQGRGDRRRLDQRGAGKLHCRARHRLPGVRQEGFHRHPPVQPDVQDPSRA